MISPNECAARLEISHARVKQILKEAYSEDEIIRTRKRNGQIKLLPHQVREISNKRGFFFKKTKAIFGNEKGGVGKSLITINVAIKMAEQGARVLVVDLDPEACATNFLLKEDMEKEQLTMLEVFKNNKQFKDTILKTRYDFLDIVPCRGKARRAERFVRDENLAFLINDKLKTLENDYDLILFEVPPTFSSIVASAYISSDIVVIPTFPDAWSIESVMLTIEDVEEEAKKWRVPVPEMKVLLNKFRADRSASKDAWDLVMQEFGSRVLPYQVKETADIQNAVNDGKSVFETKCPREVREAIIQLGDLVCPLEKTTKTLH